MGTYYISPSGSDTNTGTSESNAWKTLGTSARLVPGDELIALPGTLTGTFRPPSGTAAAPIRLRAKEAGTVTVDGSRRIDGLAWTRISKGFQTPHSALVFNVFQRDFATAGKQANFNNRDFNQYGSNPQLDLHGTPAEFKWKDGLLRLNAIPSTPMAEPLYAAVTELALDLNERSHIIVEGITTRGHKHAVGTRTGVGNRLINCKFTFCGSTGVWIVKQSDFEMSGCVIQGAGSWEGHYEDLADLRESSNVRIIDTEMSYGGHSGLIMLDGIPGAKITLTRLWFHNMGGSLLTLKRSVENVTAEDCWFADAAKSTAVDAHKVPHAGIQLSGRGHVFRNCVFIDNGKDVLASSDGNADSNPVCSDNLFDRCTLTGSEAGALEVQEYAPAGRVEQVVFRDCVLKSFPVEVLSTWFAGQGAPKSNRYERCQIAGRIRGTLGTFDNVEAAQASLPSVYSGCSSAVVPGAGSSLTKPPTPPVEPPVPPQPPNGGTVTLTALTPNTGGPGTLVVATGSGLLPADVIVWSTAGAYRLQPTQIKSRSDTAISFVMPNNVATGPVYARVGAETSQCLTFTVGSTPPVNRPPVANAGGPYSGTVGVPVQFDGSKSSDPEGGSLSYLWMFGSEHSTLKQPTFTYTQAGVFSLSLTVTDDRGVAATNVTTATIVAAPVQPLGVVIDTFAPAVAGGGTFTGRVTDAKPIPVGSTITVTARTPDGRTAVGVATIGVTPVPPSGGIVVSGYSASPVIQGTTFTINGSGFKFDALVEWDGLDLALQSITPTQIRAVAPSIVGIGNIVVRQGNAEAAGPTLEVN